MFMKWLTAGLYKKTLLIALSSMIMLSGCSLLPDERLEETLPDIVPPQLSKKPEYIVATKTLETTVKSMGKLISIKEEPLFFNVSDKFIDVVNVKNGDYVEAGTLIAKLDVADLEKQLRLDKINFQKDEREMKELLRTKDQLTPGDFEQKKIAFEEKRQKLVDLQEDINKGSIVAPFSGTVVSLSVQKGDRSTAYKSVAIIADTSQMVPAVKLTKNDLDKIAVGMETTVSISNVGVLKGKVKQLPIAKTDTANPTNPTNPDSNIERVEDFVIIELEKPIDTSINRGTPANISIVVNRIENAIVIPPAALRTIGNRTYVQVIDENGKREVDVEVGQQTSTEVEIKQGLTVGQKVVGR